MEGKVKAGGRTGNGEAKARKLQAREDLENGNVNRRVRKEGVD